MVVYEPFQAVTFEHTFLIPEDTKSAVVLESFQRIWKKEHRKCPEDFNSFALLDSAVLQAMDPGTSILFGMVRFSRPAATVIEGSRCVFTRPNCHK